MNPSPQTFVERGRVMGGVEITCINCSRTCVFCLQSWPKRHRSANSLSFWVLRSQEFNHSKLQKILTVGSRGCPFSPFASSLTYVSSFFRSELSGVQQTTRVWVAWVRARFGKSASSSARRMPRAVGYGKLSFLFAIRPFRKPPSLSFPTNHILQTNSSS